MNTNGWGVSILRARADVLLIASLLVGGALPVFADSIPDSIKALNDPSAKKRAAAQAALIKAGAEAVRPLVAQMAVDRDLAMPVLAGLGPRAVPPLIELIKGKEADLRPLAADALALAMTPACAGAAPALLACMKTKDPDVRRPCAMALVRAMGPKAGGQVPLLVAALKSGDAETKAYAAAALGQIGPKAKAAAPELILLLSQGDAMARLAAVMALGRIKAKAAVPALEAALKDTDGDVRREAGRALKGMRG